jgi:hypothetical protein
VVLMVVPDWRQGPQGLQFEFELGRLGKLTG